MAVLPVRLRFVRFVILAGCLTAITTSVTQAQQPIPGPNINMVRGTKEFVGDPFLQRQNEPSLAVSTRNPCTLFGGMNDYKTVDILDPVPLPGDITVLEAAAPAKDAWLGWTKSFDCGATWRTGLIPGYPQDTSLEGAQSGLKGFGAGADPIVRAGANGMFFFGGMVFNRDSMGGSKIFVTRWIDDNNTERGDDVRYLGTSTIDVGGGGQFLDKPWMIVDIPRKGFGPKAEPWVATDEEAHVNAEQAALPKGVSYCVIPAAPGIPEQKFAAGHVYMAWARFTGSGSSVPAKLMVARSTDCGQTWQSKPISNNQHTSQGATLAIAPHDGTVYLAWREFDRQKGIHAIWLTRSTDGGDSWEKPRAVATGISPFDQPKNATTFRTNALPTIAADHMGRVYVAWAERGYAPLRPDKVTGDARIVLAVSKNGGQSFATRYRIVDRAYAGAHQVMPALTFTAGKLQLIFYDFWDDLALTGSKFVDDALTPLVDPAHPELGRVRHTVDVAAAQADPADVPVFTDYSITPDGTTPKISSYRSTVDAAGNLIEEQTNPPNLPLYNLGTTPFIGDYIDISGLSAIPVRQNGVDVWQPNLGSIDFTGASVLAGSSIADFPFQPVFHAAWTDHRDVKAPPEGFTWADYVAPGLGGATCDPRFAGMRNANVYTSRLTNGLYVGSPGNSKPLGFTTIDGVTQHLQRAFVVFLQNTTREEKKFLVKIANQPGTAFGDRASFLQHPRPPFEAGTTLPAPQVWRVVTVPPISTVARSIYVTAAEPNAQVRITVAEVLASAFPEPPLPPGTLPPVLEGFLGDTEPALKPGGLRSSVLLNADSTNPPTLDPDSDGPVPQILGPEEHDAVIFAPKATAIGAVNSTQHEIPDPQSPDEGNKAEETPDEGNPDEGNPDEGNPDEGNPDEGNAGLLNVALGENTTGPTNVTDIQWKVSNQGNTTSGYKFRPTIEKKPGQTFQLFVTTRYYTPTIDPVDCLVVVRRNQVIVNVSNYNPRSPDEGNPDEGNPDEGNPDEGNPDEGNPDEGNAPEADTAFMLGPKATATVTLRIYSPGDEPATPTQLAFFETNTPAVFSPISIDTGEDEIEEAFSGPELTIKDTRETEAPGTPRLSASSGSPGGTVTVFWTLQNIGTSPTTVPFNNRFYLSTDRTLARLPDGSVDPTQEFEMTPRGESLGTGFDGFLESGPDDPETAVIEGERDLAHELRIPRNAPPGDYFLIIYADADRDQVEADDNNNTAVAGAFTTRFSLTFGQQPSNTTEDFFIAPPVRVDIRGGDGIPATPAEVPAITVALLPHPAGGVLSGTLTRPNVGGSATFDDLSIDNVANGYVLVAQAPGPAGTLAFDVFSAPFNIEPDDPPVAEADSFSTLEDTSLPGEFSDGGLATVLENDRDELQSGDFKNGPGAPRPATRRLRVDMPGTSETARGGQITITEDGDIDYTPPLDFNGVDSFTYRPNDHVSNGSETTVTINVIADNDPPVAVADLQTTAEDTPLVFSAAELAANDSAGPANEAGQTLTVAMVFDAVNGSVSMEGGTITFTPAPNFNGVAGYSYHVQDNGTPVGIGIGAVTVTVTAVNDAPVAVDDAKSVPAGGVLSFPAADLIANDSKGAADEAAETLTVTAVTNTAATNGTLTLAGGVVTFTPTPGFSGAANFDYTVSDNGTTNGAADPKTDVGRVNVTVVAAPDFFGDAIDPTGDAGDGNPDIVSAMVSVTGSNITLSVRYAPGTFNPSTTYATFLLDTDKNPATGHPGSDSECDNDNGVIGLEYIVGMGVGGSQAGVQAYGGECNSFQAATLTAPESVVYLADGMDVTFPLTLIKDDGRLYFKVTTASQLPTGGFTGVLDRISDVGQAPGDVPNLWSGSLSDPGGDAVPGGAPDLVSASVSINGTNVTLSARFAEGTFSAATTMLQFSLDTDKNATTGHPGTDAGCPTPGDNGLIGVEYVVNLGSTQYGDRATFARYAGTCNSFNHGGFSAVGSVTYGANGLDVTFPLSLIGNDDGRLNFKVTTSTLTGPGTSSGIQDRMTDVGQPAGTVPGGPVP